MKATPPKSKGPKRGGHGNTWTMPRGSVDRLHRATLDVQRLTGMSHLAGGGAMMNLGVDALEKMIQLATERSSS